ncbi:MAG: hypothetical protein LBB23_02805 [Rickettsiales bacterium]|jgi:hypothetical protein|nr:hypothetical protein [Rickettsiales bacterium]
MNINDKKLSISKEIGLKFKKAKCKTPAKPAKAAAAKTASASAAVRYVVIEKTEKSLANIGTELLNIGSYIGGRRFLKVWAAISLVLGVIVAAVASPLFDAQNIAFNPMFGDRLYFAAIAGLVAALKFFALVFVPMMLLVIASHYVFVSWKMPSATRAKMSCELKTSLITTAIAAAIYGLLRILLNTNAIPNSMFSGFGWIDTLESIGTFALIIFLLTIASLALYREFTYMLGKGK